MKSSQRKIITIIMVIVIFSSIFFIGAVKQNPSDMKLQSHYPYFEAMIDEEFAGRVEDIQLFKWNKSVLLFLGIEYVMLSIVNSGCLYGGRYAPHMDIALCFFHYSAFVVFFTNKKDGKKREYIHSHA